MKRYVKEIAAEYLNNPLLPRSRKEQVENVLTCCHKGMITSIEAVRTILKLFEEEA